MRDTLDLGMPAPAGMAAVEWRVSDSPVAYADAVAFMEARVEAIVKGEAPELVAQQRPRPRRERRGVPAHVRRDQHVWGGPQRVPGRQRLGVAVLGRELGCHEAWVGTEPDNVAAKTLYERRSLPVEPFVMYVFRL